MSMTYEEALVKAAEYRTADAEAKQKADEKAALQAELIAWMEETEIFTLKGDDFKLTYRAPYETHKLNQKALKADAPDLWTTYDLVSTASASLKLTIKNIVS